MRGECTKKLIFCLVCSALLLGDITFSACNGSRTSEDEKAINQTNKLVVTWKFLSLSGKSSTYQKSEKKNLVAEQLVSDLWKCGIQKWKDKEKLGPL